MKQGWRNVRGQAEPLSLLIYVIVAVILIVILLKVLDHV
jgi:hypothetical protein